MGGFDIEVDDNDYQNKGVLEYLYNKERLSDAAISDIFDVSKGTITYWRNKHNIEGWSPEDYAAHSPASYRVHHLGYPIWDVSTDDKTQICYVHRLVAVAEHGIDAVKDGEVHHKNELKWDNRPCNIEVYKGEDHKRLHAAKRRDEETGKFK